ncbi:MAG TPA: DUF1569 domain-containing protein [Tepidisphaeraceae bacterium]|nr:DUF1569 domain-containing protein [Tepidisphaeraceae bacterium]
MNAISQQRQLHFSTPDDLVAEVNRLRGGYSRNGNWTLPQICKHLTVAMQGAMRPGPHPTQDSPQQQAARPLLESILKNGKIPKGVEAPTHALPAESCADVDVDDFLQTVEAFKNFPGPFAPHFRFGHITDEQMRKLQLTHAAHHLSHLVPAS